MAPQLTASSARRGCPICHDAAFHLLFRQQFEAVDQATPLNGYEVVVCDRCGFAYADGIPAQEVFDRYYREMSKYEYHQREGAESEYDQRRLALIADVVVPQLPSREVRVLDVGCATGRLLANIRERGYPNVVGLDPSPACAAAAARLYDVTVLTMTLADLAATGQQYDVVLMVGVLEHLRDLETALNQICGILAPTGLLYLEVPDATAFADWPNAPYQDFSTEHINFFSPTSLGNLMRTLGFVNVFLDQNHREQSYRTVMSNISAMYRRESGFAKADLVFDRDTATRLRRYIAQCGADDTRLHEAIDALVADGRPIFVWGVGTHTTRLMATSRLGDANIVAFLESNARYHGRTLHDRPILAPEALKGRSEPVLISSRVFQREIADQIRNDLGCSNELVLLYHV